MTGKKIKKFEKGSGQVCSRGQGSGVRKSGQKGHLSLSRRNYASTTIHQRAEWKTQSQTSVEGVLSIKMNGWFEWVVWLCWYSLVAVEILDIEGCFSSDDIFLESVLEKWTYRGRVRTHYGIQVQDHPSPMTPSGSSAWAHAGKLL